MDDIATSTHPLSWGRINMSDTSLHWETAIPAAQAHLDLFPARIAAIVANSAGTLAVVGVAAATIRRRPVGNALILAGVAVAAAGTALAGLGVARTAVSLAVGVLLLYAGVVRRGRRVAATHHRKPAPVRQ